MGTYHIDLRQSRKWLDPCHNWAFTGLGKQEMKHHLLSRVHWRYKLLQVFSVFSIRHSRCSDLFRISKAVRSNWVYQRLMIVSRPWWCSCLTRALIPYTIDSSNCASINTSIIYNVNYQYFEPPYMHFGSNGIARINLLSYSTPSCCPALTNQKKSNDKPQWSSRSIAMHTNVVSKHSGCLILDSFWLGA